MIKDLLFLLSKLNILTPYSYERTANTYFALNKKKLKIRYEDGSWYDGILYLNTKGQIFVQRKNDFNNEFKKLLKYKYK